MVHENKYCPHCHTCYQRGTTLRRYIGSPYRQCGFCGNTFIDKDYKEPYFESPPKMMSLGKILLIYSFLWGPFFAVMFYLCLGIDHGSRILLPLIPAVLYLVCVTFTYLRREKTYAKIRAEYNASYQRLLDPNYVAILLDNGCYVAPDFLESTHPELLKRNKGRTEPDNNTFLYWTG